LGLCGKNTLAPKNPFSHAFRAKRETEWIRCTNVRFEHFVSL
jgi:hypothetical protein